MRDRQARSRAAFFSRPGRSTRGTHVGAIDEPQVPVDFALLVEPDLQRFEDTIKDAIGSPAIEPMIDALPLSIAFGQIAPRCSGSENPEHAIERGAMIIPFAAAFLYWEQTFETFPLLVADFISRHGPP